MHAHTFTKWISTFEFKNTRNELYTYIHTHTHTHTHTQSQIQTQVHHPEHQHNFPHQHALCLYCTIYKHVQGTPHIHVLQTFKEAVYTACLTFLLTIIIMGTLLIFRTDLDTYIDLFVPCQNHHNV